MKNNIEKVIAAIDYIENHLSDKVDLELVAEAVHYSKYYLHRIFTKTVGLTVHDYVKRRQLTEAAKLLVFSDKPIIEIAFIAGYESQQAFSDIFKLMYKKSPGQYRNDEEFYPLQLRYILNKNPMVLDEKIDLEKEIQFASMEDIPKWIELVRLVVDGFPCLDEKQYVEQLKDCIQKKQALILKDKDIAIGIMGITIATGSIDFLGIHPQYRKQGITQAFLKKAISLLITSDEISVTTFREGDKADTGYRNIFKNLGFAEAELLVEFGYPTQRFVLQKENWEETANE
ncbi:helix-turn-helix domain-containing protein [Mediterraneibacter sp.]|jgi:AraC-like DNA-binding protein/GNAT superfamily N-acetyltransferase|uniref:helix-turn-helix domain-containing protein n=1 Tax=Mediterraneibacter sp. TaxID=2316022 RepID=UPI001C196F8E|nr:helix-turn-helix domain-containing protein [Mediterraneibacter sp.]HBF6600524.1 GNAT family N-acetyltransferase [Clostridioides difficile]